MAKKTLQEKYEDLLTLLRSYQSVAIAFSGGVDSTLLLYGAREALGNGTVAITVDSPLFPRREIDEAKRIAQELGVEQSLIESQQLQSSEFCSNPANRCFLCKKMMLSTMLEKAHRLGAQVLVEGSNLDDMADYRPGYTAVKELEVLSPLKEVGLTKAEIRELSHEKGLPTWDKPSFACLASRVLTGDEITPKRLSKIEAAEQLLFDLGFSQTRARFHGPLVRIELDPEEISRALEPTIRESIVHGMKELGFKFVTLDLTGYTMGSMNADIFRSS